ncbi:MAG: guanylate kinase [Elusimicrobia bacterium]|nr:guanylate kinase [Elusimicrobiota bacterium]
MTAKNRLAQGFAIIISAPSGTGKSTVCRKLLQRNKDLRYSISCTTRPPRGAEKDGRDYHFVSVDEFKRRIHRDEFLEWALVHDHYYGTPRRFLDQEAAAGNVVLCAIDVQGAQSIRRKRPDTVTLFLMPPSWRSLRERLQGRRQDAKDVMERRLANARGELSHARRYDYLVVNDSLTEAVEQIEAILMAERLRTARQDPASAGLPELTLERRS